MSLQEIAEALQSRLDFMAKMDDFEWEAWLACYQALAQVKQAQASEKIASLLDGFRITGLPIENIH